MPVPSLVSADGSCCTWALLTAPDEMISSSKIRKSICSNRNLRPEGREAQGRKGADRAERPRPPSNLRSPRSLASPAAAPRTQEHRGQPRQPLRPALPHPAAPPPAPRCRCQPRLCSARGASSPPPPPAPPRGCLEPPRCLSDVL